MIAQFKQDSYNKKFSLQYQSKCDENDTLQKRTKFWLNVFDMGTPIPANVHNFDYIDPGMDQFFNEELSLPENREIKNYWIYSHIIDSETIKISINEV